MRWYHFYTITRNKYGYMKKQIIGALMLVLVSLASFNSASAAWHHHHHRGHHHHHPM
jgi:hypothetical protein